MERENNLKQFKNAYDMDVMPKFGAGSEFGREQKDVARRKKFGIMMKKYDPNAQPWLMKAGKEKVRNFKGTREGSVSENTSYYIFTQCADGAFEAYPIEDWYSFNPVINYKYLNSDEAEEIFERRDRTFNLHNIMLRKRLKNEKDDDSLDPEEGETKSTRKGKSKKDLMLTEMEDWSDSDAANDDDDDSDEDPAEKKPKKAKDDKKKGKDFKRKNSKKNDRDEAIEESDEGDYDDREVDYITDPSSESETETKKNYEDGGVEDEDGLRKINESGESEDEEEKKEEPEQEKKEEPTKKEGSDSDSSGPSSSGDDSDPEEDGGFTSALFMTNKKERKGGSKDNSASNSRSSTPVNSESNEKLSKKRKATDSPVVPAKKPAPSSTPEPPASPAAESKSQVSSPPPTPTGGSSDGISEENIRRYLIRKPMTIKELLQKFKSKTSMTNEQLVSTLGQMLKKLNPEKKTVKGKMYLSMKK